MGPGGLAVVSSLVRNATTLCFITSTNASDAISVLVGDAGSTVFNRANFQPAFIISKNLDVGAELEQYRAMFTLQTGYPHRWSKETSQKTTLAALILL